MYDFIHETSFRKILWMKHSLARNVVFVNEKKSFVDKYKKWLYLCTRKKSTRECKKLTIILMETDETF